MQNCNLSLIPDLTSGERFKTGSGVILTKILVRNQSNGFVEHSAKFWRSIFWTITWNVWPSDISVGTSWILCLQGNIFKFETNPHWITWKHRYCLGNFSFLSKHRFELGNIIVNFETFFPSEVFELKLWASKWCFQLNIDVSKLICSR